MIAHAGPCWLSMQKTDRHHLYGRMTDIAGELGFEEVPTYVDFKTRWRAAYERWRRVRRKARRLDKLAKRSNGDAQITTTQAPASGSYLLHTDGSWSRLLRRGGWAYRLKHQRGGPPMADSGTLKRSTNNRAEMFAVIHGLRQVPVGATVMIVSDSQYVLTGVSYLPRWKANDWRAGRPGHHRPLKNLKLWKELDQLVAQRRVSYRWVRGHSGDAANEQVNRLAQQAAGINI
jgi:ribonuclease HI